MPKMKTKRSAAKRFKKSGTGKLMRNKAYKKHLLACKTSKRKRHLSKSAVVSDGDARRMNKLLPY